MEEADIVPRALVLFIIVHFMYILKMRKWEPMCGNAGFKQDLPRKIESRSESYG